VRVLILGGTTEASALARALAADARFEPVLSLAGTTRAPRPQPVRLRTGGFGGAEGLARHLREHGVALLVDATHPFAAAISGNAVIAAREAAVPLLRVSRPAWTPVPGDRWTAVDSMADAVAALGAAPRRVLLTVGQKELAAFRAAPWHRYTVRSVDPPDPAALPPGARVITATGPFALDAERALLREGGIEWLVCKNSGGTATAAKLRAARELGVAVAMLGRPDVAEAPCVAADAEGALRWLLERHAEAVSGGRHGEAGRALHVAAERGV